jgi:uncharacterized protein YbjT (DUF2867 family)
VPHFASKVVIEAALRHFDVPFTIVRPNYFYQNDLSLKGPLTAPAFIPCRLARPASRRWTCATSPRAAAIALTTEGHHGKTYNVVGPEPLSGPKAASVWSGLLGKEVRYGGERWTPGRRRCARPLRPGWPSTCG